MGSVSSFGDCTRCGSKESLHDETYYKSGEVYQLCLECGYTFECFIDRDEKGVPIRLESTGVIGPANYKYKTREIKDPDSLLIIKDEDTDSSSLVVVETKEGLEQIINDIRKLESFYGIVTRKHFDGERIIIQAVYKRLKGKEDEKSGKAEKKKPEKLSPDE